MEGAPIRNARRGDIPSLLLLWEAMMKENQKHDPRLKLHERARQHMAEQLVVWLSDENRITVVAEEGGRVPIGFASAVVVAGSGWQAPERLGEITDCYVVAPRRRRGIARRLVGRVSDLIAEKGITVLRLQAAARNPDSNAFWEAIGWEPQELILERPVQPDAPTADESAEGSAG